MATKKNGGLKAARMRYRRATTDAAAQDALAAMPKSELIRLCMQQRDHVNEVRLESGNASGTARGLAARITRKHDAEVDVRARATRKAAKLRSEDKQRALNELRGAIRMLWTNVDNSQQWKATKIVTHFLNTTDRSPTYYFPYGIPKQWAKRSTFEKETRIAVAGLRVEKK